MLNVSDATKEAFLTDGVKKHLRIEFPWLKLTLRNENIVRESFKLSQAIQTSGDIDFCGCIASKVSFQIEGNIYELAGQLMKIYLTAGETEEIPIFCGFVDESTKKGIRETTKTITAYDYLKTILEEDVTDWYNSLTFPISIKNLRDEFFDLFALDQVSINLINDDITVSNNADGGTVSGKDIINAICRVNGCFGQFGNDGVFKYIYLDVITEGLYPRDDLFPKDTLYPSGENGGSVVLQNNRIIDCSYEDFKVPVIDRVILMTKDGDIGGSCGSGQNTLAVDSNILTSGFSSEQYSTVAQRLLNKVGLIWYGVADVKALGNPICECGDVMVFRAKSEVMRGYILERELSGIQSLIDTYSSDGDIERKTQYNSIQAQISKLNRQTASNSSRIATQGSAISANTTKIGTLEADLIRTNNLVANKANISDLNATNARVGNLEADHVSVSSLNAVDAKINNLSAKAITTDNLSAQSLSAGQITSGTISTDRINCSAVVSAGLTKSTNISCNSLGVYGNFVFGGSTISKKTETIAGVKIYYLGY